MPRNVCPGGDRGLDLVVGAWHMARETITPRIARGGLHLAELH